MGKFLGLCQGAYNRFATAVVPSTSSDRDAMAILCRYDAVSPGVLRRFFSYPGDKRKKSECRIRTVVQPIPLEVEWVYLLNFFYPRPVTLFLAASRETADAQAKQQSTLISYTPSR